jgi:hypothetical protein
MTGGDTRIIGGRVTEMSVTRGNAGHGAVLADSGAMPETGQDAGGGSPVPGGAGRAPLRELMDDRLPARCWSGPGTRPGGCG